MLDNYGHNMLSIYRKFESNYTEILPSKIKNNELDYRFFLIQQKCDHKNTQENSQFRQSELKQVDNDRNYNSEYIKVNKTY